MFKDPISQDLTPPVSEPNKAVEATNTFGPDQPTSIEKTPASYDELVNELKQTQNEQAARIEDLLTRIGGLEAKLEQYNDIPTHVRNELKTALRNVTFSNDNSSSDSNETSNLTDLSSWKEAKSDAAPIQPAI